MKITQTFLRYFLALMLPVFILTACGSKNEDNPRAQIAGETSKVWMAKRETNASGDKEKLSGEEKDQRMEFYANGTFKIEANSQFQGGRWNYNAGTKTMELTFDERQDVKETFQVLELNDNSMKLQAGDGSTMELKKD